MPHLYRRFLLAMATTLAVGCHTELVEQYEYHCKDDDECSDGYRCADLQDRNQTICVPPDKVEVCGTEGDEDGDGAADCADRECREHPSCVDTTDAGDTGDASDASDADTSDADSSDADSGDVNDDTGEDAGDTGPDVDLVRRADEADLILYEKENLDVNYSWRGGVAVLGDLDGDGRDDLAIGTPSAEGGKGVVSVLLSQQAPTSGTSQLAVTRVLRFGAPNGYGGFGTAVAAIGDLDGDGFSELAVGQPAYAEVANADDPLGAVHIITSEMIRRGATQDGPAKTLPGVSEGDAAGNAIIALGDVNGDSVPDFAVGASEVGGNASSGDPPTGAVYIFSGKDYDNLGSLADWETSFLGPHGSDFGKVMDAGDFDGDGVTDLVLAAPKGRGAAYVLYGSRLQSISGKEFDLGESTDPFVTFTSDDSSGQFATAVALGGSLDGDGFDDLVLSLQYATVGGVGDIAGKVFVVRGSSATISVGSYAVEDSADFVFNGVTEEQGLGNSLTYVGDINGDGRDDLLAGAADTDLTPDDPATESHGAAYLLVGPYSASRSPVTDVAFTFRGMNHQDDLGLFAAPAGDYAGGNLPGFFIYSPSGDIDEWTVDKPTWYHFTGPFSR